MTTQQPTPPAPGDPTRSPASTSWVSILLIVVGIVLTVGLLVSGAAVGVAAATSAANPPASYDASADADGVSELVLDVGSEAVTVTFGNVDDAELQWSSRASNGASLWTIERDGDTLRVESAPQSGPFVSWFGDHSAAELVLPSELESAAISLNLTVQSGAADVTGTFGDVVSSLNSGAISLGGEFGDLTATVDSGYFELDGSVGALAVELSSGMAELDTSITDDVSLSVASGNLSADLDGEPPANTDLNVQSGGMDVALPAGTYAVSDQVSSGNAEYNLLQDPDSNNQIQVVVDSGSLDVSA